MKNHASSSNYWRGHGWTVPGERIEEGRNQRGRL